MLANRTSGLAKIECEPVAKSVSRDPTVSTRSASLARVLVAGVPSSPMPPTCHHAAVLHGALAARRSRRPGRPDGGGELLELGGGVGVDDTAAGDDQRLLRRGEKRRDGVDLVGVRRGSADHPVPLVEELGREVVGVGLHVLRQRQHHGAGLDRVDQGPHRRRQRGQQLLGPGDPVEEPGDRPEGVVHGQVGLDRVLQLLQHRALVAGGVGVSRQQQHREPVDRRQRPRR